MRLRLLNLAPKRTPYSSTLSSCALATGFALLLCAPFLALNSAQAAPAPPTFTFVGTGWGHGIGLSQQGALQRSREGQTCEQILKAYFTKVAITTLDASPQVIVHLDKAKQTRASWTLSPGYAQGKPAAGNLGDYFIIASTKYSDVAGPYKFAVNGDGNITMTSTSTKQLVATFGTSVSITPAAPTSHAALTTVVDASGPFSYTSVRYRGTLKLTVVDGKLRLLNTVAMQDYLYDVVPREIGKATDATKAAVQAQAICSRSYVYAKAQKATAVACSTSDQVYGGHSRFATAAARTANTPTAHEYSTTNAAVDATNNRYVTYKGAVATTYFANCNGDATANSEDVWGSKVAYLRSIKDTYCARGHKDHTWTVKQTGKELAATLKAKGASGVPKGAGVSIFVNKLTLTRGVGGWITKASVTWSNGNISEIKLADNVRIKFGLKSGNFVVNPTTATTAKNTTWQENSTLIKRVRGTWRRVSHKAYSGGKAYRATKYKSKITAKFKGSGITYYGEVSSLGGRAKIYIDGKLKKIVQLKAKKTVRTKKLFVIKGLPTNKKHTFTIVVIKKAQKKKTGRVSLDKLVVRAGKLVK